MVLVKYVKAACVRMCCDIFVNIEHTIGCRFRWRGAPRTRVALVGARWAYVVYAGHTWGTRGFCVVLVWQKLQVVMTGLSSLTVNKGT